MSTRTGSCFEDEVGEEVKEEVDDEVDILKVSVSPRPLDDRPNFQREQTPEGWREPSFEEVLRHFSAGTALANRRVQQASEDSNTSSNASSMQRSVSSDTPQDISRSHRPDEEIVNKCLMELLQGLLLGLQVHDPRKYGKFHWSPIHKTFKIRIPDGPDSTKSIMAAKVDGCLQVRKDGVLLVIKCDTLVRINNKATRRRKQLSLRMQESAEMAASICQESRKGLLPGVLSYIPRVFDRIFDRIFLV